MGGGFTRQTRVETLYLISSATSNDKNSMTDSTLSMIFSTGIPWGDREDKSFYLYS